MELSVSVGGLVMTFIKVKGETSLENEMFVRKFQTDLTKETTHFPSNFLLDRYSIGKNDPQEK